MGGGVSRAQPPAAAAAAASDAHTDLSDGERHEDLEHELDDHLSECNVRLGADQQQDQRRCDEHSEHVTCGQMQKAPRLFVSWGPKPGEFSGAEDLLHQHSLS